MSNPVYEGGGWRFEPAEYRLARSGAIVALPGKTLDLLALLVARAPHMIPKADILAEVWPDSIVEEGNVAFHVAALRKALDAEGEPTCIETVRGRGYRFVAPLRTVTPAVVPAAPAAPDAPDAPDALDALDASDATPSRRWNARVIGMSVATISRISGLSA